MITKILRFKIVGTENRWKGIVAPIDYSVQDGFRISKDFFNQLNEDCQKLRGES